MWRCGYIINVNNNSSFIPSTIKHQTCIHKEWIIVWMIFILFLQFLRFLTPTHHISLTAQQYCDYACKFVPKLIIVKQYFNFKSNKYVDVENGLWARIKGYFWKILWIIPLFFDMFSYILRLNKDVWCYKEFLPAATPRDMCTIIWWTTRSTIFIARMFGAGNTSLMTWCWRQWPHFVWWTSSGY